MGRRTRLVQLMKRLVVIPIVISVAIVALIGCPLRFAVGIPCPGCGMTRAFLALARLDFATAFEYHPLFPIVILAALAVAVRGVYYLYSRKMRLRELRYGDVQAVFAGLVEPIAGKIAIGLAVAAFIIVYLLRFTTLQTLL